MHRRVATKKSLMRAPAYFILLLVALLCISCREYPSASSEFTINAGRKIITGQQPSISPDGTHILYDDFQGNEFLCDSSGNNPIQLNTAENSIDLGTVGWSPNGREFAYFKLMPAYGINPWYYAKLRIYDISSKTYREISSIDSIAYPQNVDKTILWSPAGDKIAYFSYSSPNTTVNIIKSDGSGGVIKTFISRAFAWSPDGTQFACTHGYPDSGNIYIGNIGNDSFTKLTTNGNDPIPFRLSYSSDLNWIPSKNTIVFNAYDGLVVFDVLARTATLAFPEDIPTAAMSPDGTRIAYVVQKSAGSADTSPIVELHCVGISSPLITLSQMGISFIWSPNSKDIYFLYRGAIHKTGIE